MAIQDNFTINYTTKTIKHTSGTTVYSVNALYSWVQDTFDELAQMDDPIPMTAQTPTEYTLVNGWFMDNASFQYLDGGAIQTDGWANEIHTVSFGATYTNCVSGDIGKTVQDDAVDFGTLVSYDNTLKKWWVRTGSATTASSGSVMTITGGTGAGTSNAISVSGENLWANPYSLGGIEAGTQLYLEQNSSVLSSWWSTGHIDILLLVKEMGAEIDNAEVTVFAREISDIYDHFDIDLSSGGRQAVPLATSDDTNNQTALATIEDLQDGTSATIAITFGSYNVDVDNDGATEPYEVRIDCDGQRLSDVYEVCKFWTRRGSLKTLDGIDGEQYVSADASYTPEKRSPLGTYAGGKFFGARGAYLINLHADDAQAYQLIDSNGSTRVPPNYQSFQVNSVVAGDRVSIFMLDATSEIEKGQYAMTTQASGSGTITVGGTIPSDTPSTGTIIVVDTSANSEQVYAYTNWSGSVFTLSGTTSVAYTTSDTAYVPYVYEQATSTSVSESVIYVSDRDVITRVRKKGILPFEVAGTFTSTGLNVTAIRTVDSIVT